MTCKKYGRLLHRAKCDPFVMLGHAIGYSKEEVEGGVPFSGQVESVASHLNELVHDLGDEVMDKVEKADDIDFELDAFIAIVPPDLWKTLSLLTQSTSEVEDRNLSATHRHDKKVKVAYLVSLILFIATGGYCKFPFHVLLTDMIEADGGSKELIKVLNRVGAVACKSSLDRHIMTCSEKRLKKGLLKDLNPSTFTVASTDNIDFLQSNAAVYTGSQHRSWHGTSTQVVQPLKPIVDAAVTQCEVAQAVSVDMSPSNQNQHPPLRRERSSPIVTPNRETRSPAPKRSRFSRARTFKEMKVSSSRETTHLQIGALPSISPLTPCSLELQGFVQSDDEIKLLSQFKKDFFFYVVQKHSLKGDPILFSFKDHLSALEKTEDLTDAATIVYFSIVDMHADTIEAMSKVADMLYTEYVAKTGVRHLLVAGDAKTFLRLKELKNEYGSELDWLIPFMGDWHCLYNYQKALMKVYYEAGLKSLAVASGHRAETLKSIGKASNFKHTHAFIMQVWEAMFREFFKQYLLSVDAEAIPECEAMFEIIKYNLLDCNKKCMEDDTFADYSDKMKVVSEVSEALYTEFMKFVDDMAKKDDTWKFWHGFVFHDCLAYVGLYVAIRGGRWGLRMAALKEMCPLFTAYDRVNYLKILPQHFAALQSLPDEVKGCLEKGGFVCSLKGLKMHSVALDEAHEMCVNKDIKETVTRPTKDYLDRVMYYYPIRARLCEQLKEQVSPPKPPPKSLSIFNSTPHASRCEDNIKSMCSKLTELRVFEAAVSNRGLQSVDGAPASPEQKADLLSFRDIGQDHYLAYVNYFILKNPSANVPVRLRKLKTFAPPIVQRRKIKQKEREQNLVSACIRRQLAWAAQNNTVGQHTGEQYLELPRAICDPNGLPHKGQKSYATTFLEKRYKNVITSALPAGWVADSVVLEGMFLINATPLVTHKTMKDYSNFLIRRFAVPHLHRGVKEVHIVFDCAGLSLRTPKEFEQSRRDSEHALPTDHVHYVFSDDALVPQKWRECLQCRKCKRELILYLGKSFDCVSTRAYLGASQKLVLGGCYEDGKCKCVTNSGSDLCPQLKSDATEADTRVWLHVVHSVGRKELLFSPDTDVYHIGLTAVNCDELDVYVQISPLTSITARFLHLNQLHHDLAADPGLALVSAPLRAQMLQTLFICSGCDYISFFAGFGKSTVMFENAWFISGTHELPGTLAHTQPRLMDEGFLSFVRLVGTMYFKKHLSVFLHNTPRALYMSLNESGLSPLEQHKKFLQVTRDSVWSRIKFEDELPPSFEALQRHWRRVCWVSHM